MNYVNKQSVSDMNEWARSAVRRSPVFTSVSQLSRVAKINCNCHCSSRSGPALKGTPGLSWLLQRPNHPKTPLRPMALPIPTYIQHRSTEHNTTITEAQPTTKNHPKHPKTMSNCLWWPYYGSYHTHMFTKHISPFEIALTFLIHPTLNTSMISCQKVDVDRAPIDTCFIISQLFKRQLGLWTEVASSI